MGKNKKLFFSFLLNLIPQLQKKIKTIFKTCKMLESIYKNYKEYISYKQKLFSSESVSFYLVLKLVRTFFSTVIMVFFKSFQYSEL